jgi:hypothetical protein
MNPSRGAPPAKIMVIRHGEKPPPGTYTFDQRPQLLLAGDRPEVIPT